MKRPEGYYKSAQRERHIKMGLCRDCTDPAVPGRVSCERHLKWAVQRKRNWRTKFKTWIDGQIPEWVTAENQ